MMEDNNMSMPFDDMNDVFRNIFGDLFEDVPAMKGHGASENPAEDARRDIDNKMKSIKKSMCEKCEKQNKPVFPTVVEEALISYRTRLEDERKHMIDNAGEEIQKFQEWINCHLKDDMENDEKVNIPNMKVIEEVITGLKKEAISKGTYYTEKINQINSILETYKFE